MSKPDHNAIWVAFACAALQIVDVDNIEEATNLAVLQADALYNKWRERSQSLSLGDEYGGSPGMFGLPIGPVEVDEAPVDPKVREEGRAAYYAGKDLEKDNPYGISEPDKAFWWESGWIRGEDQKRELGNLAKPDENSPETPEKPLVPP